MSNLVNPMTRDNLDTNIIAHDEEDSMVKEHISITIKQKCGIPPLDLLSTSKGITNQQQEFKASYTFEDPLLKDVCSLTINEPSPRFVSNGIHMKIRLENLQGNGVEQAWC